MSARVDSTPDDGDWVARVQRALDAGELRLVSQDIVPVADDDGLVRLETLVRIQDDGELISAGWFVPPAERIGLIAVIDEWVVEELLRLVGGRDDLVDRLDFCTVNISPRSLESAVFLDRLAQIGERSPVKPDRVVLEIPEESIVVDFDAARRSIAELSEAGYRIAVDDFGAGVTTPHYLADLDVDYVKIDRSVTADLLEDPLAREELRELVATVRAAGLGSIVGYVEDLQVLDVLRACDVDYAQGYGIARPRLLTDDV